MAIGLIMAAASGLVTALAIALVWRNARRLGLVQAPNARSSHRQPTPSGGGIGIVLGSGLAGLAGLAGTPRPVATILAASVALAAIGLWDDLRELRPLPRLLAEVAIVATTLALALPLPALEAALGAPVPSAVLLALLTLAIVYWVNLYNFMDGIDGLAGSEGAFLLLAPLGLALSEAAGVAGSFLFWWPLALAVATLVFLAFNWQPAKIFMGDVGSLFLGFMVAIFALLEIAGGWISPWQALILGACFITDGTVTLARRMVQGEAIMTPHRRHAYQHLARRLGSHQRVVGVVTAINVAWLLPLAIAAQAEPPLAPLLAVLAYAPLAALALLAGAGRPEHA